MVAAAVNEVLAAAAVPILLQKHKCECVVGGDRRTNKYKCRNISVNSRVNNRAVCCVCRRYVPGG